MKKQKYKNITPFNERGNIENIIGTNIFNIHQKLVNGKKLTQEEKNYVFEKIRDNSYFNDGVALMGMRLNFKPYLKRYYVKYNYGNIIEMYAFNKTNIRTNIYTKSGIIEIVEVPKR